MGGFKGLGPSRRTGCDVGEYGVIYILASADSIPMDLFQSCSINRAPMTIIQNFAAWPERTVKASDGHWHPPGYGPTKLVKCAIWDAICRAICAFQYERDIVPTHLFVGDDCRREFERQMFSDTPCRKYSGISNELQGVPVVWSRDPGIRLFYSPEKTAAPPLSGPTPATAAGMGPASR